MLCRTLRKDYGARIEKTQYGWTGSYVMHDGLQHYNMDLPDVSSEEEATKEFGKFLIDIITDPGAVYDDHYYEYDDIGDDFYD